MIYNTYVYKKRSSLIAESMSTSIEALLTKDTSSANKYGYPRSERRTKSFLNRINYTGPKILPCGTLHSIYKMSECMSLHYCPHIVFDLRETTKSSLNLAVQYAPYCT